MHFVKSLYSLLPLALTAHANTDHKHSTWMLESIISRGEGISAADGLLGEIQKVSVGLMSYRCSCNYCSANHLAKGIFQEALRAAVASTNNVSQAEQWSNYHSRSVQTGIGDLLDAQVDAKAPLDRLCAGRSLMFAAPIHSNLVYSPRSH